ncbi:MAG: alpha-amylase family glycosyl hydrolase [Butyricicoccus sp.]|nr:alpha-amylase family glycosyl hydrolase [Butyricicoccus sp.]
MAITTSKNYRNQVLYSVYVRNYSEEGTFEAVRRDLGRIKALGADIIWLMPIHPVGVTARKGSLGSPYAISDYRAVNPEFGTLEDFQRLVDSIHELGMRCIIDVVYNHTSPDSWLAQNHPEWFYRKVDGSMGNHVGDWYDIVDLDYSKAELWDYQIETLKYWASMADGFRCDVAPLVPLEFWLRARAEVEAVRPGCFWLAETVEPRFISLARADGLSVLSDSEALQAFDACYEYDSYPLFRDYLEGRASLGEYAAYLNTQEVIYPDNYVKLRFLENHDQPRAAFLIPDERALLNWTAFLYFQKGITMLYAGQERGCAHLPSLFDKDGIDWGAEADCPELLQRLGEMKKHPLLACGAYSVRALPGDILLAGYTLGGRQLAGIFSVKGAGAPVAVSAPDGVYRNLADGGSVEVKFGCVSCQGRPIIFEAPTARE